MALLAESLVEEWLNREGFFTIRGVKHGVSEMDILAVRREPTGTVVGWHLEAQVSFRPIGYICPLTKELAGAGRRTSIKKRTEPMIAQCAAAWVEKKFLAKNKCSARDQLWPGLDWRFVLVHGVVREAKELQAIRSKKVHLYPFSEILVQLCHTGGHTFSGSAGGDLAEIVRYYYDTSRIKEYE